MMKLLLILIISTHAAFPSSIQMLTEISEFEADSQRETDRQMGKRAVSRTHITRAYRQTDSKETNRLTGGQLDKQGWTT